MRITSRDFSLRLCAFSVLSARIWKATSGSGIRMAGMTLALSLVEHGAPVVAVGRPVDAGPRRHDHHRIHEAVDLLDHLLQPLGVGRREIALVGGGLDLLERQEAEDLPVIAHRLAVDGEHRAAVALDLLGQRGHRPGRLLLRHHPPLRHAADYDPSPRGLQATGRRDREGIAPGWKSRYPWTRPAPDAGCSPIWLSSSSVRGRLEAVASWRPRPIPVCPHSTPISSPIFSESRIGSTSP